MGKSGNRLFGWKRAVSSIEMDKLYNRTLFYSPNDHGHSFFFSNNANKILSIENRVKSATYSFRGWKSVIRFGILFNIFYTVQEQCASSGAVVKPQQQSRRCFCMHHCLLFAASCLLSLNTHYFCLYNIITPSWILIIVAIIIVSAIGVSIFVFFHQVRFF